MGNVNGSEIALTSYGTTSRRSRMPRYSRRSCPQGGIAGKTITYAGPGEHAVVVVGVTPTRVLINNPWSGPEWIAKSTFEPVSATYDDMALILG